MNTIKLHGQTTLAAATLLLASVVSVPAAQAAWGYGPFATATGSYNDNLRFVETGEEDSLVTSVEAGAVLVNQFAATEVRLTPKLRGNVYFSDSDLNNVEGLVTGNIAHKGPRSTLGLAVTLANESALTTELQDSGIISAAASSQRISVTPSWEYALTQRNSLQFGYGFTDVTWQDQDNTALNDYTSGDAFMAFKRRMTEQVDGTLRLSRGEFSSPDTDYESTTNNIEASLLKRFSERTSASVLLGAWNATVDNLSAEADSSGTLAAAELMHNTETSNHKVVLSQSVVPSSAGQIREDLRLNLANRFVMNSQLSVGVNAYLQQSSQVTSLSTESERSYYSLTPFVEWRMNPEVTLGGRLSHSSQTIKRATGDTDASRNEILFSVTYRKPRVTVY